MNQNYVEKKKKVLAPGLAIHGSATYRQIFQLERLISHSLTTRGGLYNFRASEEQMTDMELSATLVCQDQVI